MKFNEPVPVYCKPLRRKMTALGAYMADINGQPALIGIYDNLIQNFADFLNDRIKADNQNVIGVIGPTNSGKSTVSIQLARSLDKDFRFDTDYLYSLANFREKLGQPLGYGSKVNLFDEGTLAWSSARANTREARDALGIFDTCRLFHWTSIICSPGGTRRLNHALVIDHMDYMLLMPSKSLERGILNRAKGWVEIYAKKSLTWGDPYFYPIAAGTFDDIPPRIKTEYQSIKYRHAVELKNQVSEGSE